MPQLLNHKNRLPSQFHTAIKLILVIKAPKSHWYFGNNMTYKVIYTLCCMNSKLGLLSYQSHHTDLYQVSLWLQAFRGFPGTPGDDDDDESHLQRRIVKTYFVLCMIEMHKNKHFTSHFEIVKSWWCNSRVPYLCHSAMVQLFEQRDCLSNCKIR